MLEGAGLIVSRGGRRVLDAVDCAVRRGEILGIAGANGAGKSSLLRTLAGLLRPEAGAVTIDGTRLDDVDRRARARQIAYLPQGGHAEWAVPVRQIVALGRLPHGARVGPADDRAIDRALERMDVASLARRSIATLSGGERARVLLARALAVEAPFLLADEPTLSLDPRHQLTLMAALAAEAAAGKGVVVTLHDLTHAARYCNRLLLLDRGCPVALGTPEETLNDDNLARCYGVEALRGQHQSEPYLVPWRITAG